MATVYILYSSHAGLYYIGSTKDIDKRLTYHLEKEFPDSFTSKYSDWVLYYSVDNLSITTAKKIEAHLKRMKSKTYLENLKIYPEIIRKLIIKYR
jgi:putative endonuclease